MEELIALKPVNKGEPPHKHMDESGCELDHMIYRIVGHLCLYKVNCTFVNRAEIKWITSLVCTLCKELWKGIRIDSQTIL